jgi:hypothetical protein
MEYLKYNPAVEIKEEYKYFAKSAPQWQQNLVLERI